MARNCKVTNTAAVVIAISLTVLVGSVPVPGFGYPYFPNAPLGSLNQFGFPAQIFPVNPQILPPWFQNPGGFQQLQNQNQTNFVAQQNLVNPPSFRQNTQQRRNFPRQFSQNNGTTTTRSEPWAVIETFGPINQNFGNNLNNRQQQFSRTSNVRNFGRQQQQQQPEQLQQQQPEQLQQQQPEQLQVQFIDSNQLGNNFPAWQNNVGWGWNVPISNPNGVFQPNGPGAGQGQNQGPNTPIVTPIGSVNGGNNAVTTASPLDDGSFIIMTRERYINASREAQTTTSTTTTEEPTTTTVPTPSLLRTNANNVPTDDAVDRLRRIVTQIREIARREFRLQQ